MPGPLLWPQLCCLASDPGSGPHHSEPQFPHLVNKQIGLPLFQKYAESTVLSQIQLALCDVRRKKPDHALGARPWVPRATEPD